MQTGADSVYDVALSFAGEDRGPALALASRLQVAGYRVFFDRFEELWGQDLSVKLHAVYARQSRFCVVFVSEHYLRKPWTNRERQIVMARAMQQEAPYLLPLRLDDAELPGLPDIVAYKDLREESIDTIALALQRLLGPAAAAPAALPAPAGNALHIAPSDFLYVVVEQSSRDTARFNLGCHLVNPGAVGRELLRLEATLAPAGQCGVQFMAGPLYEIGMRGRAMQRSYQALPLTLGAGESRLLGVQFIGPRIDPGLVWAPCRSVVEVVGWVDRPGRREPPDLQCRFGLRLGEDEASQLAPWLAADGPEHRALLPAVAIPVAIGPAAD